MEEFLERVERLCKVVADSIEGNATSGSAKEALFKMADEAADLAHAISADVAVSEQSILEAIR